MPYPEKGETKEAYISRCIPYVIKEGTAKDEKQAAAICYSFWEKKNESLDSKIDKYLGESKKTDDDLKNEIVSFIVDKPYPKDSKFHSFAEKMGIEPDDLESLAYSILSDFWANGRYQEKGSGKKFDAQELKWGIEIEAEHTVSKFMAERIAKDHLTEIPDYYTRLKKMEKEAGIKD